MANNIKIRSAFILLAIWWNLNLIIQHNVNDGFLCYSLDTNYVNHSVHQSMSCVSASRIMSILDSMHFFNVPSVVVTYLVA